MVYMIYGVCGRCVAEKYLSLQGYCRECDLERQLAAAQAEARELALSCGTQIAELDVETRELRAELARVRNVLSEYGGHKSYCTRGQYGSKCDCGFTKAMELTRERKRALSPPVRQPKEE